MHYVKNKSTWKPGLKIIIKNGHKRQKANLISVQITGVLSEGSCFESPKTTLVFISTDFNGEPMFKKRLIIKIQRKEKEKSTFCLKCRLL